MSRYYERAGQPISLEQWAETLTPENQRVAHDTIGDAEVSTVWLGLDHSLSPDGPPLIFETMIFGGSHSDEQWCYTTEDEARAGHERAVEMVRLDQVVEP